MDERQELQAQELESQELWIEELEEADPSECVSYCCCCCSDNGYCPSIGA